MNDIGELFILGFFGKTVPAWLKQFAVRYGLGGVILFDYSCRTQTIRQQHRIARAGARYAPRLPRCLPVRWCSSTRRAAWCGG